MNSVSKFIKFRLLRFLPDDMYLKLMYRFQLKTRLNLDNPTTFNEKLQWLKLYNRRDEYTTMVDKYEAKKYVAQRIGEQYIIPTFGVWNHFDEIDFDSLPNQFVLKCTHDSGGLVICRDKSTFDKEKAREKIEQCLKNNFYWSGREWPYKNVLPRIIAEKYMENADASEIVDYKMMCFDGKVKCCFTCTDRQSGEGLKVTFFDTDWHKMPFERHYPADSRFIEKPISYEEMCLLAEKLSAHIPFTRIDFYEVKGKPYFGEITLYPGSGFEEFSPQEWDNTLGEWIKLPEKIGGGYLLVNKSAAIWVHEQACKTEMIDYKFFCFDGIPKFLYVSQGMDKHDTARLSFLTVDWNFTPYERSDYEPFEVLPSKPKTFDSMLECAKSLSEGHSFLRVDLYEICGQVFFSELTFFPCSGFMPFRNPAHDAEIGRMLILPDKGRRMS